MCEGATARGGERERPDSPDRGIEAKEAVQPKIRPPMVQGFNSAGLGLG